MTRNKPRIALAMLVVLLGTDHGSASTTTIDLEKRSDVELVLESLSSVGAGDINHDGDTDLAFGECRARSNHRGVTHVRMPPFDGGTIKVTSLAGFKIRGADAEDGACGVVAGGDINGDGIDDLIIGAAGADNNGRAQSGTVYVVFSRRDGRDVDLADFDEGTQGDAGFRIDGAAAWDFTGQDLAAAGDVNGDGLRDILIGVPFAGASYVVFGKATADPVDLRDFYRGTHAAAGFRIDTPTPIYSSLYSVGGVGDVNGDGLDDVAVGVITARRAAGSTYVIFGKTDPLPVDTWRLELRGFRIRGADPHDTFGYAVAGAGDANGDGLDDIVVGAPRVNDGVRGRAYIVFGKTDSAEISVKEQGPWGFKIVGYRPRTNNESFYRTDPTGAKVAGAGDINGDGLADVIVASPSRTFGRRNAAGVVYVVYGRKKLSPVRLRSLGSQGYRIIGGKLDEIGAFVLGPGDLNGDDIPDVLTTALFTRAHLVWGRRF